MPTSGSDQETSVESRDLAWEVLKGAGAGAVWGVLGLIRPSGHAEGIALPLQTAAIGSLAFGARYFFDELSRKSRSWYYAVWAIAMALAAVIVRTPAIIRDGEGLTVLLATAAIAAVAGLGFARVAEGWRERS